MADDGGRLVENVMHFARLLRATGIPIGPGKVVDAVGALRVIGLTDRRDFYWALHAVFVNRQEHRLLFDEAFRLFWRDPQLLERMLASLLPSIAGHETPPPRRRLADAINPNPFPHAPKAEERQEKIEIDSHLTWSSQEVLQTMDFDTMSAEELRQARDAIARMRLPIEEMPMRRTRPDKRGARVDMRATLRGALRSGDMITLRRAHRRTRHPPLVALCDISGSMSRYSRMFLHFLHAITNDRDRVHTFLFGTRLTNVTRHLRHRDVDVALEKAAAAAADWSGGTRIGTTLHEFNKRWSRRVLGQGAVVLFISDGLDRDAGEGLSDEMERLHKSCRRLIWLNPLLRYDGFEPRSLGVRAILPHVDEFRAVHNLVSLADLAEALTRPARRPDAAMDRWREAV